MPSKKRSRARIHTRRRRGSFNQYMLDAIMNTGLDRIRNLADLRKRSKRMAEDSPLWDLIEKYLAAAKQQAEELERLREYMDHNYGSKRRAG